jgi:hypothetical protein
MSTISSIPNDSIQNQMSAPSLHLQDIANLLSIVDLAAQRGAFRAQELSQIGETFDKINKFLQVVMPSQQANSSPSQQAPSGMGVQPPMPTPVQPITPPFTPKIGV